MRILHIIPDLALGGAETYVCRLAALGVAPEESLVALNPGVARRVREWEPQRFAQLGDTLRREAGARSLFTGGPPVAALNSRIQEQMQTAAETVDLTGQTSLRQIIPLYQRCALFIGAIPGRCILQRRRALPCSLAIHGPTDPRHTGPYASMHRTLYKNWHCSPCRCRVCPNRQRVPARRLGG